MLNVAANRHIIRFNMQETKIYYSAGSQELHGLLVVDNTSTSKKPGVLVAHAWKGQDDFAREKARDLAKQGYIVLAVDLYGEGTRATSNEEALALMSPLFIDRLELQSRILAGYEIIKRHPMVDPKRIGAVGFCFGGLTVIELLRSGADVRGVVSFHGVLGDTLGELKAKPGVRKEEINSAILILHGNDDPLVSSQDLAHLELELTRANVDWQLNVYGHTLHAFTNPEAHQSSLGLLYNKRSAARAWLAMQNFFNEVL